MKQRTMPQREGIFWGRKAREPYFDMIVHISGTAPFLKVDIFHLFERRLHKDADIGIVVEWGPEIEDMSQYNTERAWQHALDDWRIECGDNGDTPRLLEGSIDRRVVDHSVPGGGNHS